MGAVRRVQMVWKRLACGGGTEGGERKVERVQGEEGVGVDREDAGRTTGSVKVEAEGNRNRRAEVQQCGGGKGEDYEIRRYAGDSVDGDKNGAREYGGGGRAGL